ncbi:MAG: sensor histidine kinase [Ktedonobacterales bacterium]
MPLAAYSIALLPRGGVVALCGLLLLLLGLVDWRVGDTWKTILLLVLSMLASCIFVIVCIEAVLREAQARQDLDEAHQRLSDYAAQIETLATVAERNRLAREIHDNLGHYLTIITVQLEAARATLGVDITRARRGIETAEKLAREGLGEIRGSVAALRALPTENRSLPEALADLVRESQAAGMPPMLTCPSMGPRGMWCACACRTMVLGLYPSPTALDCWERASESKLKVASSVRSVPLVRASS